MLADRGQQVEPFDNRRSAVFLSQPIPETTDCHRGQIDQRKLCNLVLKNGRDVTLRSFSRVCISSHT